MEEQLFFFFNTMCARCAVFNLTCTIIFCFGKTKYFFGFCFGVAKAKNNCASQFLTTTHWRK